MDIEIDKELDMDNTGALIKEKLSKLPDKPGVYIMQNAQRKVIYVGKAKVLKNRVRSYFTNHGSHSVKTQILVRQIADFDYIVTSSELEALILECNLIKKYSPKYNILLKDGKTYPYIKITWQEDYPRVFATRRYEQDGSLYFGPFADVQAMHNTLDMLKQTFKLRTCRTMSTGRPCLRYYIKECLAPCQGYIDVPAYRQMIENVRLFLNGRNDKLIGELKLKIGQAAASLNFEQAIIYKEQLLAVKTIQQEQKVITKSDMDMDIIGLADSEHLSCVQVLLVRDGKLVGQKYFYLKNLMNDTQADSLNDFLKQYYTQTTFIPSEIVLSQDTADAQLLSEWLSIQQGRKIKFTSPQRGQKRELLDMARENATLKLLEAVSKEQQELQEKRQALLDLAASLGLDSELKRIECFDISHNQGQQTVASMVVFIDGLPAKKYYKRYKLKTVEGKPDDFLSMQEVIGRRYSAGEDMPDLIVIDGGKGQLSSVMQIMQELGLAGHIPVVSLAKQFEHIFLPGNSYPIVLEKNNPALHIMQNIRDEAHRFAITYHRKLRDKKNVSSLLEHIEGVGANKRAALMQHFKSIAAIKQASISELQQVKGIHKNLAGSIHNFFRRD